MQGHPWVAGVGAAFVLAGGVLTGVVGPGAPAPAAAATAGQEEEQAEALQQRLEETRARLNLTDEQVDQVRPILRAGFEAMLEVFEEHGIDPANPSGSGRRLRLRQLRRLQQDLNALGERTLEELGAVLNDEQIEGYKEIQKENREAIRERLRGRR